MTEHGAEVLLVEDNPNDEMLTLYALKSILAGKIVHVVRDGAAALEFVFRTGAYANRVAGNPRLILLDKKLPLVDGLDVLRQIRAEPATSLIPIVMLTSSEEERDIARSYDLGANSYIVKPMDFDKFTETARSLGGYWLFVNKQPAN